MLGLWWLVIYFWKGLEHAFPTVYYTPQKIGNLQSQIEKEKMATV
jgi:hypothetical protein